MTAAYIAEALNGRRSGSRWLAHCPAHKDRTPSLSISESEGRILVHCFSGCTQDAVVTALRERGFWPESPRQNWTQAQRREYGRRRSQVEVQVRRALDWRNAMIARLGEAKAAAYVKYLECPTNSSEKVWADASQALFRYGTLSGSALMKEFKRALQINAAFVNRLVDENAEDRAHAEKCTKAVVAVLSLAGNTR
jgi:hypothetical protein